ncbi:hypothetical protein Tco_0485382 [Tanacetum coccineum]
MERAATTASSLEAEQDSGSGPRCQDTILGGVEAQSRFETASKQSNDSPLSRVNTLGSGEDSMKLMELIEHCTTLSELFWATAKVQTINEERQLQDLVDKKKLGDMSHHKKTYVNPSHIKKIFANMKREGKDFSGRVTPMFETMMVQANQEEGADSATPTNYHSTPIISQPSSSKPPKKKSRRKQRKDSAPTEPTTEETPDEAHSRVLALETTKSNQSLEIKSLKKRLKSLEKRRKSRTLRRMHPNRGGKLLILMLMQK